MSLELVGLVEVVREYWGIILPGLGILGLLLWRWGETRIVRPIFDQIWSRLSPISLSQSPFDHSSTPKDLVASKSQGGHLNTPSERYEARNLTPHLRKSNDTDVCEKCGSTNIKTNRTPVRSADYRAIHVNRCRKCEHQWKEEV